VSALRVLSLSDSFGTVWPELAADCALTLVEVGDVASVPSRASGVLLVNGAGVEETLAETLRAIAPGDAEIIAVGALPSHRIAVQVVRAGALEYFALPDDMPALRSWLRDRAERLAARGRRSSFADRESAKYRFEGMIGSSEALRVALERASRVIPHGGVTVLIAGETGTGKELLARAIHYNGPRREAPFVDVNCAAIPEQLLESELFGHEKGAFTDASAAKPGLFEVAHGGTLFLDEIGHLPLGLQGKLLRVLEERTIRRVGGTKTIPVNVRIIAASHVELGEAVQRRQFREDLFYRLNVVPLELPPLRHRREDIVPLARHFLARFAAEYGVPLPALTAGAERALVSAPWPGNIRELRNAMERALLLGNGGELEADDVVHGPPVTVSSGDRVLPFPAPLRDIVAAAVRETVERCGGNKSDAARRLGISRSRLQRLLDTGADESADYE
jgi:DNA-binding NtrC family response regulator